MKPSGMTGTTYQITELIRVRVVRLRIPPVSLLNTCWVSITTEVNLRNLDFTSSLQKH